MGCEASTATMTTYTKPSRKPFLDHKKSLFDYELERTYNRRLRCILGLTLVALVLGAAALSLSLVVIIKGPGWLGGGVSAHQTYANIQVSMNSDIQNSSHSMDTPRQHENQDTIILHESHGPTRRPPAAPLPDNPTPPPANNPNPPHADKTPTTAKIPDNPTPPPANLPPSQSTAHPVDVKPLDTIQPFIVSDDEDLTEGSGMPCPMYPRPVCPMGLTVCPTTDPCPKFECCRY